jgi:hypothetical protein
MEKFIIMGMEIIIKRLSRASKHGQTPGGRLFLSASEDLAIVGFAWIFLAAEGGLFSLVPAFLASTPGIDKRQVLTDKVRRRNEVVRMTVK